MSKSLHYVKCCIEKLSNSAASCLSEQETVAIWTILKDDARAIVSRYELSSYSKGCEQPADARAIVPRYE